MALTLRTAVGRTTPLSNLELDGNFTYLETQSNLRLVITDYNYSTIIARLNGAPSQYKGFGSGIDVRYLQGNEPNSVLPNTTSKQSVVLRDATGNFSANVITASLTGKSTTSGTADVAIKLQTPRNINAVAFDGSADITIYDKTKLPVETIVPAGSFVVGVTYLIVTVGNTNWIALGASSSEIGIIFVANGTGTAAVGAGTASVVMVGKLTTKKSTTGSASLNIPAGTAPTSPVNGDIWSETATGTLFNKVSGATRQFAYLDSNITGTAANVTGVVQIDHGGTGKTTAADARLAMSLAKSGANSDITSITGLTTALASSQGGTGLNAPGAAKNILISDGTIWTTAAPSGTWDINISGEAATAVKSVVSDTNTITTTPATFTTPGVVFQLKQNVKENLSDGGTYFGEMTFRKAGNDSDFTKGKVHQLGFTDNTNLYIRSGTTSWGSWYKFLNSNNYNSYAPTLSGVGASGTWDISINGSAGSAGSAGYASTAGYADTAGSVSGSAGSAATAGTAGYADTAGYATSSGSATKLSTARYINGVAFDGTADITITSAATAGTADSATSAVNAQNANYANTANIALSATKLQTIRYINGVAFDGTADISIAIPTGGTATDVYLWAKAPVKPTYNYNELAGTKPSYTYSELSGTVPTWNQSTTGTAANATKWGNSTKYVQSSAPTGAAEGDIWFQV